MKTKYHKQSTIRVQRSVERKGLGEQDVTCTYNLCLKKEA